MAYRPEIDGLRAIAVSGVVLYHLEPGLLPGGFAGVDVFFVISGYLITSLLLAEWRASGRIDLAAFYARRVRRLMPALWLVIATVLLLSIPLLGPLGEPFYANLDSAKASLLFLANLHFLGVTGDYFAGPAEQLPLLHLWSLAVEEQFYLVFPLLLAGLLAWRRAVPGLWLLTALSLLLAQHWLSELPSYAFFHMPTRFWELAAGALVALSVVPQAPGAPSRGMTLFGLALLVVALVSSGWYGHFPGAGALPAVLGTVLVLVGVHRKADLGLGGRLLAARPVVAIGLWSYALYLWHWPLLALDRATHLTPSTMAWRAGLCVLALVLAALTYRYVEQPVRRGMKLAPRTVLLGGLAVTVLLLAATHGLGRLSLVPADRQALVERTRSDRPADMATCHYDLGARVDGAVPSACQIPKSPAGGVAIWGDSHALAWRPFAEALAARERKTLQPITMDACSALAGPAAAHPRSPRHAAQCDKRNELAVAMFTEPGAFDTVVLAGRWFGHTGDDESRRRFEARLGQSLDRLATVPRVIVLASVHELPHLAATCIAMGSTGECAVPRTDFEAKAGPIREALRRLAADHPNVSIIDPADFFCGPDECPVLKDGYSLFWDDDHVSSSAARGFARAYLADPARYTLAPTPPSPPGR